MDNPVFSYALSSDGPYLGSYPSRREAIAAAVDENPGCPATIYTAENEPVAASDYVDVASILEDIACAAADDVDDVADGWPCNVTEEAEAELKQLVSQWLERHSPPTFWRVRNIESSNRPLK